MNTEQLIETKSTASSNAQNSSSSNSDTLTKKYQAPEIIFIAFIPNLNVDAYAEMVEDFYRAFESNDFKLFSERAETQINKDLQFMLEKERGCVLLTKDNRTKVFWFVFPLYNGKYEYVNLLKNSSSVKNFLYIGQNYEKLGIDYEINIVYEKSQYELKYHIGEIEFSDKIKNFIPINTAQNEMNKRFFIEEQFDILLDSMKKDSVNEFFGNIAHLFKIIHMYNSDTYNIGKDRSQMTLKELYQKPPQDVIDANYKERYPYESNKKKFM